MALNTTKLLLMLKAPLYFSYIKFLLVHSTGKLSVTWLKKKIVYTYLKTNNYKFYSTKHQKNLNKYYSGKASTMIIADNTNIFLLFQVFVSTFN